MLPQSRKVKASSEGQSKGLKKRASQKCLLKCSSTYMMPTVFLRKPSLKWQEMTLQSMFLTTSSHRLQEHMKRILPTRSPHSRWISLKPTCCSIKISTRKSSRPKFWVWLKRMGTNVLSSIKQYFTLKEEVNLQTLVKFPLTEIHLKCIMPKRLTM